MPDPKFRVWDKFQKKYVFTDFSVVGEVTVSRGIDSIIQETFEDRRRGKILHSVDMYDDFTVEQALGRQDINLREVYEGDIDGFTGLYIEYRPIMSAFELTDGKGKWRVIGNRPLEVVGNLHT